MPRFAANLSFLFNEVDFMDRFEAAAKAGFLGVEFMFPYAYPAADIKSKLDQYGLTQVLHNLPPGDWNAGERGIACHPDRVQEFEQSVELAIEYAQVLGCARVNCLAGIVPTEGDVNAIDKTFIANIKFAAEKLKPAGIKLVIEAINTQDMPGFYLTHTAQALDAIAATGSDNIDIQYDIYHMQIMEGNIAATLEKHLSQIGHIQLADSPGRHEPGTGEIDFPYLFSHVDKIGYEGWIGCEYRPTTTTTAGLGWAGKYLKK